MIPMKLRDGVVRMREVSGRFPCVFFLLILDPFYQVDKLVANAHAVQDLLNFVFVLAFDV